MENINGTPRNGKRWADCGADEKAAIDSFYTGCHPSNEPDLRDACFWEFSHDRRKGQLAATYTFLTF